ncbi:AbrB/MazE/SpoVT family DNA-binding domain-containing protein [Bacillus mycoides]|uniref:AbrB/MazE/SpoVT family DNA-binding domain-containing protein n=1 Tax=Bacillus mycoides TaxID=1405 RepID=UPI003CFF4827
MGNVFESEWKSIEQKEITITGKRQITIPKNYYDYLGMENSLHATLTPQGIFLKPSKKKETVYEEDIQKIVSELIAAGYKGGELAKKLSERIAEYEQFLNRKIEQFQAEMEGDVGKEDDFHGLDIFFDEKNGKID